MDVRYSRCPLLLACVAIALALCPPAARGQAADRSSLREEVLAARRDALKEEATRKTLEEESRLVAVLSPEPRRNPVLARPDVSEELARLLRESRLLQESGRKRQDALRALARQQQLAEESARISWREAALAWLTLEERHSEAAARVGAAVPGERPVWWPPRNGSLEQLILCGAGALLVSLFLTVRESHREEARRRQAAGEGASLVACLGLLAGVGGLAVVLAALVTAVLGGGVPFRGPDADEAARRAGALWLEQARADARERADRLRADNEAARTRIAEQRKGIARAWTTALGLSGPEEFGRLEDGTQPEDGAYPLLHKVLVRAHTIRELADDGLDALKRRAAAEKEWTSWLADRRAEAAATGRVRLAIATASLVGAVLPLFWVRARRRRRYKAQQGTCPRCFTPRSLTPVPINKVLCKGRLGENKNCNFKFPAEYARLPRIAFPTVGVFQSGKTHWLVGARTFLDQHPGSGSLRCNELLTPEGEFRDQVIRLKQQYAGTSPTQWDPEAAPPPLLFTFTEHGEAEGGGADAEMPDRGLVTVYDFAGEVTGVSADESAARRRALLMDGFLVFLDPTRDIGLQKQRLERFPQELRLLRRALVSGRRLRVPVAVCLTKLDLIPTRAAHHWKGAMDWIKELKETATQRPDLARIQARAALVEKALTYLFHGWDVRQTLWQHFGRRLMFFPVTPVGIEEPDALLLDRDRVVQLGSRAQRPFGVIEPMQWLLHMQGHRVLV